MKRRLALTAVILSVSLVELSSCKTRTFSQEGASRAKTDDAGDIQGQGSIERIKRFFAHYINKGKNQEAAAARFLDAVFAGSLSGDRSGPIAKFLDDRDQFLRSPGKGAKRSLSVVLLLGVSTVAFTQPAEAAGFPWNLTSVVQALQPYVVQVAKTAQETAASPEFREMIATAKSNAEAIAEVSKYEGINFLRKVSPEGAAALQNIAGSQEFSEVTAQISLAMNQIAGDGRAFANTQLAELFNPPSGPGIGHLDVTGSDCSGVQCMVQVEGKEAFPIHVSFDFQSFVQKFRDLWQPKEDDVAKFTSQMLAALPGTNVKKAEAFVQWNEGGTPRFFIKQPNGEVEYFEYAKYQEVGGTASLTGHSLVVREPLGLNQNAIFIFAPNLKAPELGADPAGGQDEQAVTLVFYTNNNFLANIPK